MSALIFVAFRDLSERAGVILQTRASCSRSPPNHRTYVAFSKDRRRLFQCLHLQRRCHRRHRQCHRLQRRLPQPQHRRRRTRVLDFQSLQSCSSTTHVCGFHKMLRGCSGRRCCGPPTGQSMTKRQVTFLSAGLRQQSFGCKKATRARRCGKLSHMD